MRHDDSVPALVSQDIMDRVMDISQEEHAVNCLLSATSLANQQQFFAIFTSKMLCGILLICSFFHLTEGKFYFPQINVYKARALGSKAPQQAFKSTFSSFHSNYLSLDLHVGVGNSNSLPI